MFVTVPALYVQANRNVDDVWRRTNGTAAGPMYIMCCALCVILFISFDLACNISTSDEVYPCTFSIDK